MLTARGDKEARRLRLLIPPLASKQPRSRVLGVEQPCRFLFCLLLPRVPFLHVAFSSAALQRASPLSAYHGPTAVTRRSGFTAGAALNVSSRSTNQQFEGRAIVSPKVADGLPLALLNGWRHASHPRHDFPDSAFDTTTLPKLLVIVHRRGRYPRHTHCF